MRTPDPKDQAEVERLKQGLRVRLANVCSGWSEDDKEKLFDDIARLEIRFREGPVWKKE